MRWNEPAVGNGRQPRAKKIAQPPQAANADERLYTLQEVGERLGKSAEAVRQMILRGELPGVRIGARGVRVHASDFAKWIEDLEKA